MVKSCATYNCTNRVEKCKPLNFDRFPLKNEDLCRQWVIATRRQTFTPNESNYIYGDRFTKTDHNRVEGRAETKECEDQVISAKIEEKRKEN